MRNHQVADLELALDVLLEVCKDLLLVEGRPQLESFNACVCAYVCAGLCQNDTCMTPEVMSLGNTNETVLKRISSACAWSFPTQEKQAETTNGYRNDRCMAHGPLTPKRRRTSDSQVIDIVLRKRQDLLAQILWKRRQTLAVHERRFERFAQITAALVRVLDA